MELKKDCLDILFYLKDKNDFIKISDIAEKYNLTERAIRYKIDKIDKFLVRNKFDYIEKKHNKGIKLSEDDKLYEFIDEFRGNYTPFKYSYSKDERFKFIVAKLLESSEPVNLDFFESMLSVSKNTVLKEIDIVEEWLKANNLSINRGNRRGMLVIGDEIDKRDALKEVMSQSFSSEEVLKYVATKKGTSKIANLQFSLLFSEEIVEFLDEVIRGAEIILKKEFTDESYGGIFTHLAIMIKRIQLGKELYIPSINEDFVLESNEYKAAEYIIERIKKKFNINVPDEEKSYIVVHLLGARVLKDEGIYSDGNNRKIVSSIKDIVEKMTGYVEENYGISFGEERERLINDLVLHLRPIIYRLKFGKPLNNPFFEEIKLNYKELFQCVRVASKWLEEFINVKVDEHEISYIVIHYAAAIRNHNLKKKDKTKVVIICGTGIGTAKMLEAQIKEMFFVKVVATLSSRAIKNLKDLEYDVIISSVNIPDIESNEYIKVNPMLLKEDIDKLQGVFRQKKKSKDYEDATLIKRILSVVEKYCDIKDREQLQYELLFELKREAFENNNNEKISLKDIVKLDSIITMENVNSFKEALIKGCEPLINRGLCNYSYTEEILYNLDDIGPYIVIAPGIALAHGKGESSVNGIGMSILNLKYPVKSGHVTNDPVRLIITFCTNHREKHLKALSELMELLNNTKDLKKLMTGNDKKEILDTIYKYSK
ncbi:Transcriptional antiterminator [Clostridium cavendishii DSM 21758]|uniref:Transcriptional antiterminator n=1 Tax=Clostridium cavendishii DSM 21758 TaxID=1121302 RepID=A0A1M6TE75_9CLOT|nr:BglG family transcription antiterminator [Clostridium cavendishii]SHK55297.1 Transcriptional antiterminator [Clostridium cavendishii DSM 21758]